MDNGQCGDWKGGAGGAVATAPTPAEAIAMLLRNLNRKKVRMAPTPYDVLVQCPKCKTVETLQFVGDTLTPSRKFYQSDGRVYHDCGSEQPCRLHR